MPLVVKCPNCRKETTWENNPYRPFCSDRCQLIDLGAWTEERYKIPGEAADTTNPAEDDDEEAR
jgi:endogenous inhibitor of DNA gyrase (YacG/DUF329 family)